MTGKLMGHGKSMGHNPENWDMTLFSGKGIGSLGFSGYVPIFHVPVFRIVSLKFRLSPGKR
jgi:hypothetical protein